MKTLALNSVVIPEFQTDVFFQLGGTTDSRLLDVSPGRASASGIFFNHHFPNGPTLDKIDDTHASDPTIHVEVGKAPQTEPASDAKLGDVKLENVPEARPMVKTVRESMSIDSFNFLF